MELLRKEGIEPPSAYALPLPYALQKAGTPQGAYQMLREKGWITSPTTMYGTKSKPSLLERAKNAGYIDQNNAFIAKFREVIESGQARGKAKG